MEIIVPTDLRKALSADSSVTAMWKDLTSIARRDFVGWIDGAKDPDMHVFRIEKTCMMLAAGKRSP